MESNITAINKYYSAWFDFELRYPHNDVKQWMVDNRFLSVILGAIYLSLLLIGRLAMKNREAFSLRKSLSAWNAFMFLLSCSIFVRVAGYCINRALNTSFYSQMCVNVYEEDPLVFWLDVFVISKPLEFIDTLFIVLRKQPLHFLHYYHHSTVVILCWYSLGIWPGPPNALYFAAMNSFIHTAMYLYYLLRSMRITLPRSLQMSLTGMQIAQMGVGCFINCGSLAYRLRGQPCVAAYESIFLALGIYSWYFALFANYFRKTYFSTGSSRIVVTPTRDAIKTE